MGDHTHGAGEWMVSYRYMAMSMDGLRDGTDSVSTDDILRPNGTYMMAPEDMTMQMHMLGVMYAPTDSVTLMAMANYIQNDMTVRRRMPMMGIDETFETSSSGIGDTTVSALVRVAEWPERHSIHLNLGLSLPTGSIDETDDTPMGDDTHLPYAMQLGSGTFDLKPGVTWLGQSDRFSWGAQTMATIRLGENDQEYTLGDRYEVTTWGAWKASEWASLSTRLLWSHWDNIDGSDKDLSANAPNMNPNADPDLRAGDRVDLGLGVNLYAPADSGWAAGNRLGVEVLLPIHQDLEGPQMETEWSLVAGWQYAF